MQTNVKDAVRFLRALDPAAHNFNLRSFPDEHQAAATARKFDNVRLEEISTLLDRCNTDGHGLFVVINQGGQRSAEIDRVRAVFLDIDRKDFTTDSDCESALRLAHEGRDTKRQPIPPNWPHASILVRSGGGGYHLYWLVDDCPTAQFKQVQQALAHRFHGDRACCDLARVMRLPGSIHAKGEPVPVTLEKCDPTRRYALDDLLGRLSLSTVGSAADTELREHCDEDPSTDPVVAYLIQNPEHCKPGGHNDPAAPIDVVCPNADNHSKPDSVTSTVYMPHGLRARQRAFHCSHGHCEHIKLRDFLRHIGYEEDCPNFNTDDGLACRFVGWLDGRAMHSHGNWYAWTGAFWKPDSVRIKELIKQFASSTGKQISLNDAMTASRGDANAKQRLRTAASLLNEQRQQQVLKAAATMLHVPSEELDAEPDLLTVPNGTIDLRTGELLNSDPQLRSTLCAGVCFEPASTCLRWDKFLHEIFPGDPEMISYLQRLVGYFLTGHMREEVLIVGYGTGANGKSVLAEVLRHILGDYAITADPSLLLNTPNRGTGATPEAARLAGRRLCLLNETKRGDRLDDGQIKKLVSTEKMTARELYQAPFEFYPTAKPFLRTNNRLEIHDNTEGMWRRLHLIPFTTHFSRDKRDPHLLDTLKSELTGVLAWAVRGAQLWYLHGLQPPGTVREATSSYRQESDQIAEWLEARTEGGGFTSTATLHADFVDYADLRSAPSQTSFSRELKAHGIEYHRKPHARGFVTTLKPKNHDNS